MQNFLLSQGLGSPVTSVKWDNNVCLFLREALWGLVSEGQFEGPLQLFRVPSAVKRDRVGRDEYLEVRVSFGCSRPRSQSPAFLLRKLRSPHFIWKAYCQTELTATARASHSTHMHSNETDFKYQPLIREKVPKKTRMVCLSWMLWCQSVNQETLLQAPSLIFNYMECADRSHI